MKISPAITVRLVIGFFLVAVFGVLAWNQLPFSHPKNLLGQVTEYNCCRVRGNDCTNEDSLACGNKLPDGTLDPTATQPQGTYFADGGDSCQNFCNPRVVVASSSSTNWSSSSNSSSSSSSSSPPYVPDVPSGSSSSAGYYITCNGRASTIEEARNICGTPCEIMRVSNAQSSAPTLTCGTDTPPSNGDKGGDGSANSSTNTSTPTSTNESGSSSSSSSSDSSESSSDSSGTSGNSSVRPLTEYVCPTTIGARAGTDICYSRSTSDALGANEADFYQQGDTCNAEEETAYGCLFIQHEAPCMDDITDSCIVTDASDCALANDTSVNNGMSCQELIDAGYFD